MAENKIWIMLEEKEFDDSERSIVAWASKPVIDRDMELILGSAWNLDSFLKNPVLMLSHDYRTPPIGRVLWTKATDEGLKFKAKFAKSQVGEEIYSLYKDGIMKAFSVGFVPKASIDNQEDMRGLLKDFNGQMPRRVYTEVELLEISCVSIPSCPDALVELVKSGKILTKCLVDIVNEKISIEDFVEKGAISYSDHGAAEEGASWDAGAEVKAADVKDLKIMCAWYDAEKAEDKGAYKLPHHKQSDKKSVWNGVRAAMAALFGARGGVQIPSGDRRGVYNHLAKEYKHWDKEVPDFKEYSEEELKTLFPDFYKELEEEFLKIDVTEPERNIEIELKPETTENYHHIPVKSADLFVDGSFRTIDISKSQGIKAIIGKLKSDPNGSTHVQKYLFDINKWTMEEAKKWVADHAKGLEDFIDNMEYYEFYETVDIIEEEKENLKMFDLLTIKIEELQEKIVSLETQLKEEKKEEAPKEEPKEDEEFLVLEDKPKEEEIELTVEDVKAIINSLELKLRDQITGQVANIVDIKIKKLKGQVF